MMYAPAGWIWAKNARQAIARLYGGGIAELSLDHDLGSSTEATGYAVAARLEAQAAAGRWAVGGDAANHPHALHQSAGSRQHCRGRHRTHEGDRAMKPLRLNILSDVPLEFDKWPRQVNVQEIPRDVHVLAGDIGVGFSGLQWALEDAPPFRF